MPLHVIFSSENANSIVDCIARARDNARTMRHQVATEMWEALNRFHLEVQRPARRRRAASGRGERHSLLPLGRRVQPAAAGHHRLDDAARGGLVLPPGGQVPGAGGVDGPHPRRELPAPRRRRRRARRPLRFGRGGSRPAAVGHAPALAVGVRVVPPHREQRHPAERGDRAAHPLGRPATLDPLLDRAGRRRARPHQRAGARLQRLRADAGRGAPRARRGGRSAGCTRSSPISGSTTYSITACTLPCSTSSAAATASATVSRTSSSPTGR